MFTVLCLASFSWGEPLYVSPAPAVTSCCPVGFVHAETTNQHTNERH